MVLQYSLVSFVFSCCPVRVYLPSSAVCLKSIYFYFLCFSPEYFCIDLLSISRVCLSSPVVCYIVSVYLCGVNLQMLSAFIWCLSQVPISQSLLSQQCLPVYHSSVYLSISAVSICLSQQCLPVYHSSVYLSISAVSNCLSQQCLTVYLSSVYLSIGTYPTRTAQV